jgi:hypothetical protein
MTHSKCNFGVKIVLYLFSRHFPYSLVPQLINTKSFSNAASSTVAKRVLASGSTDEAASFIFVY